MSYLAQVSLYWLLLYGCYWLVLRHDTFFAWNRAYLLGALVLSFALPLIHYPEAAPPVSTAVYELTALPLKTATTVAMETAIPVSQVIANTDASTTVPFPWTSVLGGLYAAGALFMLGRLLRQFRILFSFIQKGERIDVEDYTLILLNSDSTSVLGSFSFLRWVLVTPSDYAQNFDTILSHELVHVRQRHSWDILLVEVLRVLFWFNPILIFYKRSLQQVHEYLADHEVCAWEATPRDRYAEFMVSYALGGPGTPVAVLTNPFFNSSLLKDRITMLYKNRNSNWSLGKYAAVALLIGFVTMITAFKPATMPHNIPKNDTLSTADGSTIAVLEKVIPLAKLGKSQFGEFIPNLFSDEISLKSEPEQFDTDFITNKDQSPSFPGGAEAMRKFISQKVTYPARASRANVQGKVLLNFVVSVTGELQNVEIVKNPGFGLKEESLRLISSMPTWEPGQKDGKKVPMRYDMTLDFQLSDYKTIAPPVKVGTLETQVRPDGENGSVAVVRFYPYYNRDQHIVNYRIFHSDTLQNALYILNATPMKNRDFMKDLTIDELQSVRVLDVKTARRLYGQKGSNGVVQVFTKNPKKN